jgi:adenine-specific DNA-methyltransferase
MVEANTHRGQVSAFVQGYKRYRVSSQRFSEKPMNVEFVIMTDTSQPARSSSETIIRQIMETEEAVLAAHSETRSSEEIEQGVLF